MNRDAWVVVVGNFATGVEAVVGPFSSLESLRYPDLKTVTVVKVCDDCSGVDAWSEKTHVGLLMENNLKIDAVVNMGDYERHDRPWDDGLHPVISPERYFG